jgi:hypothetical protein
MPAEPGRASGSPRAKVQPSPNARNRLDYDWQAAAGALGSEFSVRSHESAFAGREWSSMQELTAATHVRARDRKAWNCSFCQAPVEEELALKLPKSERGVWRESAGWFCSTRCLTCVQALAALHPSPLASHEFREARGALIDRLLALWRSGAGPDPALVLEATRRVASRAGEAA